MFDESTRARMLLAIDETDCVFMDDPSVYQSTYRIIFNLFHGSIPEGHQIKHRCHNKSCINPHHIYPFDQKNISHRLGEHATLMDSGCIEWTGHRCSQGYGRIQVNHKDMRTHRLAYELAYGPIPEGLVVRHKCDNPPCINPSHLEIGTQKDNIRDRDERGRTYVPAGEDSPHSKLTDEDVRLILESSDTLKALGARFGVNSSSIFAIKNGRTWKHLSKQN